MANERETKKKRRDTIEVRGPSDKEQAAKALAATLNNAGIDVLSGAFALIGFSLSIRIEPIIHEEVRK